MELEQIKEIHLSCEGYKGETMVQIVFDNPYSVKNDGSDDMIVSMSARNLLEAANITSGALLNFLNDDMREDKRYFAVVQPGICGGGEECKLESSSFSRN